MYNGQVIINVSNQRATVAQYVGVCGGVKMEPAQNWQELEPEALAAVEATQASVAMSGYYPCPPELAQRAVFRAGNVCAPPSRQLL